MFALPESIRVNFNGPLARAELTALRRQMARRRRWLWRCFTLLALALASIPLWISMQDSLRSMILFPIIIIAVYGFQLNVVIKTLTLASHSVARESLPEAWDSLVLTGVDARRIVLAKWIAVLRCVWPDFVWSAVLKLGVAWGLAQYFDTVAIWACYKHLGGGLCYLTDYRNFSSYGSSLLSPPNLIVLLTLFSLAEASLLAALGLCFGFISRQHRLIGLSSAALLRGVIVFAAVIVWVVLSIHSHTLNRQVYLYQISPASSTPDPLFNRWNMSINERQEVMGTAQLVLSPLADGGTLLITDLLRPSTTYNHVLERLATTGIALTIFGGLIWSSLRLAEAVAVRQHALRPEIARSPDEELALNLP